MKAFQWSLAFLACCHFGATFQPLRRYASLPVPCALLPKIQLIAPRMNMVVDIEDSMTTSSKDICPFRSRFYPRTNSIPFRRNKDVPRKKFWLPGQRSLVQYHFMNRRQRTPDNKIEWRDDIVEAHPYSAVATLVALWETVANASNSYFPSRPTTNLVAFPDANANLIEQWVLLMRWFMEQHQNSTSPYKLDVLFNMTVVDFIEIPTVAISCEPLLSNHNASRADASVSQPDPETVVRRTKSWVQRILVDQSICPFTKSVTYSGQGLSDVNVPLGRISYHVSSSSVAPSSSLSPSSSYLPAMCQLQADTWRAIYDMLRAGPIYSKNQNLYGISSILLAAPGWDNHFTEWSGSVFALLEAGVVLADATEQIGVVCFHPLYQTPDGRSFPGFGHMHSVLRLQQWLTQHDHPNDLQNALQQSIPDLIASNLIADDNRTSIGPDNPKILAAVAAAGGAWQRRTPHATINVLRADQLAAAEGKRSTPTLYASNILRLCGIGWQSLAAALNQERQLH